MTPTEVLARRTKTNGRDISCEDILPATTPSISKDDIFYFLNPRCAAIIGAGSELGITLAREILKFAPRGLLLIDQNPATLFELDLELHIKTSVVPITAEVARPSDRERLEQILRRHKPGVIFDVDAALDSRFYESDPAEAIKRNVLATDTVLNAAVNAGCTTFVRVSALDAIRPTTVVGATLRLAEACVASYPASGSSLGITVRLPEIIESKNSVFNRVKWQILSGGPLRISGFSAESTWIRARTAALLLLEAASSARENELFAVSPLLPLKLSDLTARMLRLLLESNAIEAAIGLNFADNSGISEPAAIHRPAQVLALERLKSPSMIRSVARTVTALRQEVDSIRPERLKALLKEAVPDYLT